MPKKIHGYWYPAGTSQQNSAQLTFATVRDETSFCLWHGGQSAHDRPVDGQFAEITLQQAGDFHALQFSERLGDIRRKVIFADGSVFETTENDALDLLLRAHG